MGMLNGTASLEEFAVSYNLKYDLAVALPGSYTNEPKTSLHAKTCTRTNNPKICVEPERHQIAKAIFRKNKKGEGITFPNFKRCYKEWKLKEYATGLKTDVSQWKRLESPEINPHICNQ